MDLASLDSNLCAIHLIGAGGESRTLIPSLENLYTNRCTTPAQGYYTTKTTLFSRAVFVCELWGESAKRATRKSLPCEI